MCACCCREPRRRCGTAFAASRRRNPKIRSQVSSVLIADARFLTPGALIQRTTASPATPSLGRRSRNRRPTRPHCRGSPVLAPAPSRRAPTRSRARTAAMAPMNLRRRIGMAAPRRHKSVARVGGSTIWSARLRQATDNEPVFRPPRNCDTPRDPALALRRSRAGARHGSGRRRDAAHRIRPLDHRMAAGHGHAAAAERRRNGRPSSKNIGPFRNTASSTAA